MPSIKSTEHVDDGNGGTGVQLTDREVGDLLQALQDISERLADLEVFVGFPNDWGSGQAERPRAYFGASGITPEQFDQVVTDSFEANRPILKRLVDIEQAVYTGNENAYQAKITALETMALLQALCQSWGLPLAKTRLATVATGNAQESRPLPALTDAKTRLGVQLVQLAYNLAWLMSNTGGDIGEDELTALGGNSIKP